MFDAATTIDADLPLERLEAELCVLAARSAAGMCRWLELLAEYDRREGYLSWGIPSAAAWVAWKCAVDTRTARDHVRVARSLGDLPLVRERFAAGELSYSKVRAITRIATPEHEAKLVEFALTTTTAQLERVVRAYRNATDDDSRESALARAYFEVRDDDDGMVRVSARMPAAEGAVFRAAFERQAHRVARERWSSRQAEAQLRGGSREGGGGGKGGSGEPLADASTYELPVSVEAALAMAEASSARETPAVIDDQFLVVVHVLDDGTAQIDDGPGLPASELERVACGASVQLVTEDDQGNPLFLGRRRRTASPAQRRALAIRDGNRCRFPGCEARHFLRAHHVHWWTHGGRTNVDQLALLCRRHHDLVHDGVITMECQGSGRFVFRRGNGAVIDDAPALPSVSASDGAATATARAAAAPVGGTHERMNLDFTITALLSLLRPDLVLAEMAFGGANEDRDGYRDRDEAWCFTGT